MPQFKHGLESHSSGPYASGGDGKGGGGRAFQKSAYGPAY